MVNEYVTKRLEIRATKDCKTCKEAIQELTPLAIEHNIPCRILPALKSDDFTPIICFIAEGDAVVNKTCIKGYSKGVVEVFNQFVKG